MSASRSRVRAVGQQVQVPSPVGGLNARDAITSMPPQDALTLDNIFPEPTYAISRRGSVEWASGFVAPVETIMEWNSTPAEYFAASGSEIFDITSAGPVGAAVVSGLTNARWQTTMFSNTGGTYLAMVNGADGVHTYDGSAWAVQVITGATNEFTQIATYKKRLWFCEMGTSTAWYLGLDAISGAATAFELGGVWRLGGTLARIFAVNYDTLGAGLTEYLGFLSTTGEMAVYSGTDPSSSTTWALVGVFRVAGPAGTRTTVQVAGDINILTQDGVLSMLGVIQTDPNKAQNVALSSKITPLLREDWLTFGALQGWQIVNYAPAHAMLVNVPTSATTFRQYVMNTLSGAWCQFLGWNAYCFGMLGQELFYGAENRVVKAWSGLDDEGAAIVTNLNTAFNTFKSPGLQKRFTMLRPLVTATSDPAALIQVSVDYELDPIGAPYVVTGGGALWDVALWDVDMWGGGLISLKDWATVGSIGRAGSVGYSTATIGVDFRINGFDLMLEAAQGPAL